MDGRVRGGLHRGVGIFFHFVVSQRAPRPLTDLCDEEISLAKNR